MKSLFVTAFLFVIPFSTFAQEDRETIYPDENVIEIHDGVQSQTQRYNYNFGRVRVDHSARASFTIRNTGTIPLYINDIDTDGTAFTSNDNCPRVLTRGNSCRVRVRFSPAWVGYYQGELEINLSGAEDIEVDLRGRGVKGKWDN